MVVDYGATVSVSHGSWLLRNSPNFVQDGEGQQAGEEGGGLRIGQLPAELQPGIPDPGNPPYPSQDGTQQPPSLSGPTPFPGMRSVGCLKPKD